MGIGPNRQSPNNEDVDDSEVDAFQMIDDNEGIAQQPDIEF